ncbi:MAG: glycosyltransferase family 2 protein, partial [Phycisphaerae bacterium]|nr:glycosyltransferase family 2 protein [Phycisphaerae bacterium]
MRADDPRERPQRRRRRARKQRQLDARMQRRLGRPLVSASVRARIAAVARREEHFPPVVECSATALSHAVGRRVARPELDRARPVQLAQPQRRDAGAVVGNVRPPRNARVERRRERGALLRVHARRVERSRRDRRTRGAGAPRHEIDDHDDRQHDPAPSHASTPRPRMAPSLRIGCIWYAPPAFMVTILIPAKNEESAITGTVQRIQKVMSDAGISGYEILVINDGSSDRTGELAKAAGARVVTHPHNAGYGRSLKHGIRQATHDTICIT